MPFIPKRVFFEKEALNYPLGEELYRHFRKIGIPVNMIGTHNRVTGIPGKTPQEAYMEAKQTFVVGVRKTLKFETCKPSAHYQLPLCTSCIGKCEYCYLNTTLGKKPYLRVYVNIEEILDRAQAYIKERAPKITYFEGAATSDPLPFEAYTGALAKTIEFFAKENLGRFRFVTKFTEVDSLLRIEHTGHTRFRFSLNSQPVIERYEHNTPGLKERVTAAVKVAKARYPLGFIIAPVILYEGWQQDYQALIDTLAQELPPSSTENLSFEIITHRFTARAKNNILSIFPKTTLPMKEEERQFKFGQFGYGKYVYPKVEFSEVKEFFTERLSLRFPHCELDYIV
ncbi:MAG: spore photoproduct lyase [Bacillota bacterium]|uniref:Spore photoproduct lyase n=1 Tax=Thermanaerosceptrum fracticalcis TaxID=1712410 RepID=A0A7G6DZ35_THEFR|nr:spore photoproduct lyase [Thermanaerosceptrum fracticalcis]QNB45089.1 spore photoproduct lyase [Thermanaerosceptrum fracticalcis]